MRYPSLFAIAVGALVLSGCASIPEPTFGQLLGNRADEYRDLKKSWQAGTALKSDGAKDIEKGEDLIKRGEKLIKQGESLVTQGKANVQQGSEEVDRAEANYIKMIATPAVPSAL